MGIKLDNKETTGMTLEEIEALFQNPNTQIERVFDSQIAYQQAKNIPLEDGPCPEIQDQIDRWSEEPGGEWFLDWEAARKRALGAKPKEVPDPVRGYERMRNRNSPYATNAAHEAREDARRRLPVEYAQRAESVIRKAAKGAKFPNHNIMTLSHAYAYVDCGLHVVDSHALTSKTKSSGPKKNPKEAKIPRGPKWEQRATTDADLAGDFWAGNGEYPPNGEGVVYPYAGPTAIRNVSIPFPEGCGQGVLDIDGEEGKKWLKEYEAEYGPLPKTPKSITGSGGYHFIFLANDLDIRNTASAIAPGVDIRGRNGQILAPPSIHPSGTFYRWEDGCAPWECEIAEAPERLLKLAYEATKGRDGGEKAKSNTKAKAKSKKRAKHRDSGADNARGFADHVALIGDGDGLLGFDTPIYRAACSWWATNPKGESDELKELLRDAIISAPCKDDRAESRYATDEYLENRIEQARDFIAENLETGAGDEEPEPTTSKTGVLEKRISDAGLNKDSSTAEIRKFLKKLIKEGADSATTNRAKTLLAGVTALDAHQLKEIIKELRANARKQKKTTRSGKRPVLYMTKNYQEDCDAIFEIMTDQGDDPLMFHSNERLVDIQQGNRIWPILCLTD